MRGTRGELKKRKTVAAAVSKVIVQKRKKSEASKYVARPGELCYGIGGKPCVKSVESSERDGTRGFDIARFPVHFEGACLKCWEAASPRGECPCVECSPSRKGVFTCFGTSLFECPKYIAHRSRFSSLKQLAHGVCSACSTAWNNLKKSKKSLGNKKCVVYGGNHALKETEVTLRCGKSLQDCVSNNPVPFHIKVEDSQGCKATALHELYKTVPITCALCDDTCAAEYRCFEISDAVLGGGVYNLCLTCHEGIGKLAPTIGGENDLEHKIHQLGAGKNASLTTRSHRLVDLFDFTKFGQFFTANACRFCFRFSRVSTRGGHLARAAMNVNDVLTLFDRCRTKSSDTVSIFPGEGPFLLIPEIYSKGGSAMSSLVKSCAALPPQAGDSTGVEFQMTRRLTFSDMVQHVNDITALYTMASVTLMIGTIADLGTTYAHLLGALFLFHHAERVFILVCKVESMESISVSVSKLVQKLEHPGDLAGDDDASRVLRTCHHFACETLRGGGSKKRTGLVTMPHIDTLAKATQSQSSGAIPSQKSVDHCFGNEIMNTRSAKSKMRVPILLHGCDVKVQNYTTGSEQEGRDVMDELKMLGRVARKLTKPPANEPHRWWTFDEDEDERVASETKSSSLEKRKKSVEESNRGVGQQLSNASLSGRVSSDKEAFGGSGSKRRRVSWSPTIQGYYAPDASLDRGLSSQETTLTSPPPPPRGRRAKGRKNSFDRV